MQKVPEAFHQSVVHDPLFAAEGMDLTGGEYALMKLKETASDLEKAFASQSFKHRLFLVRYPIAQYAIPFKFLRQYINAERARRAYMTAPTFALAQQLLDAWRNTAAELQSAVLRYEKIHHVLLSFEPPARDFTLHDMFGNLSSFEHIQHTLDMLNTNAEVLCKEVEARSALLHGEGQAQQYVAPPLLQPVSPATITELERHTHELELQGTGPYWHANIKEAHGPFSYVLPHFDGTPTAHSFMFYILKDQWSGVEALWISVVDLFLFAQKSIGTSKGGQQPFAFKGMIDADIRYWFHAAGHPYTTRDPSYWMDIASRIDLMRRPHLNATFVSTQRASLYHLLLGACEMDLRGFVNHTKRRAHLGDLATYPLLYGLLTRTYPSLYYMTFNKSVWRLPTEPAFLGERFFSDHAAHAMLERVYKEAGPEMFGRIIGTMKERHLREQAAGWLD